METIERQLQRLDPEYRAKSADGIHDMLLAIGDLTEEALLERILTIEAAEGIEPLADWAESCCSRSRASSGSSRSRMRPDIVTRSASRCRRTCRTRCDSRSPIHWATLLTATRERTPRSERMTLPAATTSRRTPQRTCSAALHPRGDSSKANSVPAARRGSGPSRECCACCGAARSPSCGTKSSRSSKPGARTLLDNELAGGDQKTARCGRAARRGRATAGRAAAASILESEILPARVDAYSPADLDAVRRRAKWSGSASKRSATVTDESRSISPTSSPFLSTANAERPRGYRGSGGRYHQVPSDARRVVLRPTARSRRRRLPRGDGLVLWSLAWKGLVTNDTFHALRGFAQARAASSRKKRTATGRRLSVASSGPAVSRGPLGPGGLEGRDAG